MNSTIQSVGRSATAVVAEAKPTASRSELREEIASSERPQEPPSRDALRGLSDRVESGGRIAEFSYNQELDRVIIRIYSSATEPREIVRQIPPEEYMTFAAKFREMIGLIFDERV